MDNCWQSYKIYTGVSLTVLQWYLTNLFKWSEINLTKDHINLPLAQQLFKYQYKYQITHKIKSQAQHSLDIEYKFLLTKSLTL